MPRSILNEATFSIVLSFQGPRPEVSVSLCRASDMYSFITAHIDSSQGECSPVINIHDSLLMDVQVGEHDVLDRDSNYDHLVPGRHPRPRCLPRGLLPLCLWL